MYRITENLANEGNIERLEKLHEDVTKLASSVGGKSLCSRDTCAVNNVLQAIIMDNEYPLVEDIFNNGLYASILIALDPMASGNDSVRLHYTISVSTLLFQLTHLAVDTSDENMAQSTNILRYNTWLLTSPPENEMEDQIVVSFIFAIGIIFAVSKCLDETASILTNHSALIFIEAAAQFICVVLRKLR